MKLLSRLVILCPRSLIAMLLFSSLMHAQGGGSSTMYRALHMGGNWGANKTGIPLQPKEYYDYLRTLGVNWVAISIGLHVAHSLDSTVERVYNDPGNVPGFIPTFQDQVLIEAIRGLRRNHMNVLLTLCFETAEASQSQYPFNRWELGDPNAPNYNTAIKRENWPWDTNHPLHQSFVRSFWRTYTEQAVYYAGIAQAEGVQMFAIGAESDRLFRTRTGGAFPNHFRSSIKGMVDSVRRVYSGPVTYEQHWGVLADTTTFGVATNYLWDDAGLDVVGISAYFQLAPQQPTSVLPVGVLEGNWEHVFAQYLIPLKNRNPVKPMLFLEFGYVDVVGSPNFADLNSFIPRVFTDNNGNGKDDGEETQSNIHEAFFIVNERHNRIVQGVFLWGNEMASAIDWQNSFGGMRTHSVRNKLAANVVKTYYAGYTPLPQPPILISPGSNAQGISLNPSLIWHFATDASTFTAQLSELSDFSSLKVDSAGIVDTVLTVRNLKPLTTYYWRIASKNNAGASPWSSSASFTTVATAPLAPTLLSPANGATGAAIQPALSWSSSSGASSYRLQISAQSGFSPLVLDDSTLTNTSRIVGPLSEGTTYYWRVSAKNSAGSSPWSTAWMFMTMTSVLAAPVPLTPGDGAMSVPTQPSLSWSVSAGATLYRLQVSTQSTFGSVVLDDSMLTQNSRIVGPLAEGTLYYWRIQSRNSSARSSWSTVVRFTTVMMPPTPPSLLSPAPAATGVPLQPSLSWSASLNGQFYWLQVSTNSGFSPLVLEDSLLTTTSRTIGPLVAGAQYFWRVRAKNAGGVSPWSSVFSFTTQPPSDVEWISDQHITEYRLHNSYPNPFNPMTVFSYQIPDPGHVRLGIYTVHGREVATLVNEHQQAGLFRVSFSGVNLPSGVYYVRLHVGSFWAVQKIVLVR